MAVFLQMRLLFCLYILFAAHQSLSLTIEDEFGALLDLKSTLDPQNIYLTSWTVGGHPCAAFEGVGCTDTGHVSNISLQGRGLSGELSPSIAALQFLTGLYLHYNSISGEIPAGIGNLTLLTDLYLNMNNISGEIPPEIGNLESLQVLQLSHNQLTGSIPTQLGSLKKLSVVSLQSNYLTGAIPASLGDLPILTRLDLGFNRLFGSIPTRLSNLPLLEILDIQNNTLSGNVPPSLKRLSDGFLYENNFDLCGTEFTSLKACNASTLAGSTRPEPFGTDIPETANVQLGCNQTQCSKPPKSGHHSVIVGTLVVFLALSVLGALMFTQYRRRKQKLGITFDTPDSRLSTDHAGSFYRKNGSPLASLEYSVGWDPLSDGRMVSGFPQEVMENFKFNLEEVESATQYFSEANLLGKSNCCTTYKGILRDGSLVVVKCITKTSCKSDESEFLKGLNILTSLRHENLVRLRGFCCSRGRGECFLVYDFVPNGNLLRYLDLKDADGNILEWSTRVSIVKGIAKGISYLHGNKSSKPTLLHQNISAEKVLMDQRYNPLLADSSLHKLLTNDLVFSSLKSSAAMGYLAPEYASTGRFTDKSDVYAFGILVLQLLSGKRKVTTSIRLAAETNRLHDIIDRNLSGRFFEYEALKLVRIALLCTHESPAERPAIDEVIKELGNCSSCL